MVKIIDRIYRESRYLVTEIEIRLESLPRERE